MPKREKNVVNYIYVKKLHGKKIIKELLELELTSRNKKVTPHWENIAKGLIKIRLKKNKMLKVNLTNQ